MIRLRTRLGFSLVCFLFACGGDASQSDGTAYLGAPELGFWRATPDGEQGGLTGFEIDSRGLFTIQTEWTQFAAQVTDEPEPVIRGRLFFDDETAGIRYVLSGELLDARSARGELQRIPTDQLNDAFVSTGIEVEELTVPWTAEYFGESGDVR